MFLGKGCYQTQRKHRADLLVLFVVLFSECVTELQTVPISNPLCSLHVMPPYRSAIFTLRNVPWLQYLRPNKALRSVHKGKAPHVFYDRSREVQLFTTERFKKRSATRSSRWKYDRKHGVPNTASSSSGYIRSSVIAAINTRANFTKASRSKELIGGESLHITWSVLFVLQA